MYRPPQCSEREPDGTWENCTECSGIMLGNAAHGRQVYPTTQTEYDGLRAASGRLQTGGSNVTVDLPKAMKKRWGWSGKVIKSPTWDELWAALKPGVGAVVQGSMGSLPVNYRRHDPAFGRNGKLAPHAGYAQREDSLARVWWMNPQARKEYAGEWMTALDLRRFFSGLSGASVMTATIGSLALPDSATEEEMVEITIDPFPKPIGVTGSAVTAWLVDGTHQLIPALRSLASGTAIIDQSTERAPKGAGWIRLAARPWAGWYVPAASVKLETTPGDALQDARAAGRESYRREVDQYVETHP